MYPIFIEAGRCDLRLSASVKLPPLTAPTGTPDTPAEVAPAAVTGDTAPPTTIPPDAGLPCGGQGIATLKPAQLAMLVGKVTRLAEEKGGPWEVLRQALQTERAQRLTRGQRRPGPRLVPEGEAHEA